MRLNWKRAKSRHDLETPASLHRPDGYGQSNPAGVLNGEALSLSYSIAGEINLVEGQQGWRHRHLAPMRTVAGHAGVRLRIRASRQKNRGDDNKRRKRHASRQVRYEPYPVPNACHESSRGNSREV